MTQSSNQQVARLINLGTEKTDRFDDPLIDRLVETDNIIQANLIRLALVHPQAKDTGAEGAVLLEHGNEIARARPPHVAALDGTAAGDAFTAGLVVSLREGREPDEALRRACAAGALAASRFGAQPSLPTAAEVDAILRA